MAKIFLADKETLDKVNENIGNSDSTGSENPTSIFSGIKNLITNVKTLLTNVNSINTQMNSVSSEIANLKVELQNIKSNTSSPSGIKKILQSNGTVSNPSVTHESVDVSKSIILLNAATNINNNPLTSAPSGIAVNGRTATSFTVYSNATNLSYSWQIIEFY